MKTDHPSTRRWLRHVCYFLATLLAPILSAYLATEVHLAWYLYQTGETRAQQSDNYGLGFEALLIASATAIVVFALTIFLWWFTTPKKKSTTD